MFRVIILLENESTADQVDARWYGMALQYAVILLFFQNSFDFYHLTNACVTKAAPNHDRATTILHSWQNTFRFESFIDFSADELTPMSTEKFKF